MNICSHLPGKQQTCLHQWWWTEWISALFGSGKNKDQHSVCDQKTKEFWGLTHLYLCIASHANGTFKLLLSSICKPRICLDGSYPSLPAPHPTWMRLGSLPGIQSKKRTNQVQIWICFSGSILRCIWNFCLRHSYIRSLWLLLFPPLIFLGTPFFFKNNGFFFCCRKLYTYVQCILTIFILYSLPPTLPSVARPLPSQPHVFLFLP